MVVLLTEDSLYELDESGNDIVIEPGVTEHGEDGVTIGGEAAVFGGVEGAACEGEARFIERIAAHHAADGVGEK